jgi:hypothetical protein
MSKRQKSSFGGVAHEQPANWLFVMQLGIVAQQGATGQPLQLVILYKVHSHSVAMKTAFGRIAGAAYFQSVAG